MKKRIMRTSLIIIGFVFFVSTCVNSQIKGSQKEYHFNSVNDFYNYKNEFDIVKIKKMKPSSSSRLDFYKNSCGMKFEKDSVKRINSYILFFQDNSNTEIQVITLSSINYAKAISEEINGFVEIVRNFKNREENKKFCVAYYLSRIYNYILKKDQIYLFSYDRNNASSKNITNNQLKNIDSICNALR